MQTQTISKPRTSLSPHQNRTENAQNKLKLRLSSFETATRIYDNRGYATHLHKMFDSMNKSPSRRPSPNKSKMISSSFVNPMLNSSSHDIPAPLADSLLTEGPIGGSEAIFADIPSGSILPTVSRGNLSRGKHKRTASMLTPPSEIITVKDGHSHSNTKKGQRTPLSFLGDSPLDLFQQDNLTQKQRKESPFIRTQLFHYSTQSTKNERLAVTPNRRVMIAAPSRCKPEESSGRSPIRSILDSAKKEEHLQQQITLNNNHLRVKGYEKGAGARKSPMVSWKQVEDEYQSDEDVASSESMLPNMEDMLIIRHEIQGSQTSLILTTSEDFDRDSNLGDIVSRSDSLKNKRGIVKMKSQMNNERTTSNKHVSIMSRTLTPKNYAESRREITGNYGARHNRAPSGSPYARSRERQTIVADIYSNNRSRDSKQEYARNNRSNSRPHNITEESEWQLTTKINESEIEMNAKRVNAESPLKVFRRTQQNGFYTTTTPKKPESPGEKRLEYRRPEHKREASISGGGTSFLVNSGRKA